MSGSAMTNAEDPPYKLNRSRTVLQHRNMMPTSSGQLCTLQLLTKTTANSFGKLFKMVKAMA